MSSTVFVNGVTLSDDDWFNDLNRLHYTILSDPADLPAVKTTLHGAPGAIGGVTPAAGSFTTLAATGVFSGTAFSVSVDTATATTLKDIATLMSGGGAAIVVGKNTEASGAGAFIGVVSQDKNGTYTTALLTETGSLGIALSMSGSNLQLTHTQGSTKTYAGSIVVMQ